MKSSARLWRLMLPFCVVSCLAILFLVAGCSKDLGRPHQNLPPETGVFVQGDLDTVNYAISIYWWGQDVDGEVIGFYYRWTCADPAVPVDTSWVFTTEKSKNFILPVPDGFALQTFWVKAVDNKGIEDQTPAMQSFPVRNSPPTVAFEATLLPDTTLPATTFSWNGTDPDGNASIAYYVAWVDGKEDDPFIVAGSDTTIGPDYLDSYGARTFYLRAVDEAQSASPIIEHTWYVLEPIGDVLLVDDVPATVAGAATTDAFYRAVLDSLIPSRQYTIFDVGSQGTFLSPTEVSLVLPLFKQVVWYGDTRNTPSAALVMGERGIAEFLLGGGDLYLEGIALLGTNGSLSLAFAAQYLGIDSLRTRYVSPAVPSTTNFDLMNGWIIRADGVMGLDSLMVQGIFSGCEIVHPSSLAAKPFYLPPGTYSGQTQNYYLGTLLRGPGFSTVTLTFPVRRCNGFATAKRDVAQLLTLLGVGQP